MSYTPTTWNTGDTITASALNKMEQGIAEGGGASWDAVIRLVHANNSGEDNSTNLTPYIISGSFADLESKLGNGLYPCILIEYSHPWGAKFSAPMGYIIYWVPGSSITITVAGYSYASGGYKNYGALVWYTGDSIYWN